jgi:hypothetical protein
MITVALSGLTPVVARNSVSVNASNGQNSSYGGGFRPHGSIGSGNRREEVVEIHAAPDLAEQ